MWARSRETQRIVPFNVIENFAFDGPQLFDPIGGINSCKIVGLMV